MLKRKDENQEIIKEENLVENTENEKEIETKLEENSEELQEEKPNSSSKLLVDEEGFAIAGNEKSTLTQDAPEYAIDLEKDRLKFLKLSKIINYINYALFAVVIIVFVLIYIFVMPIDGYGSGLGLGLVILFVAALFLYIWLGKKYLRKKYLEYAKKFYQVTTDLIFDDKEKYSNVTLNTGGNLNKEVISNARIYTNIANMGSRNVVGVCYKNLNQEGSNISYSEVSMQRNGEKKLVSIFLGRVLVAENEVDLPGRILLQIRSKNDLVYSVNDIDGLDTIIERNNLKVYSNLNKAKLIITSQFLSKLDEFKYDNDLLDIIISITPKQVLFALDYNDSIMRVADNYKETINYKAIERLKVETNLAFELIEYLNEKVKEIYKEEK